MGLPADVAAPAAAALERLDHLADSAGAFRRFTPTRRLVSELPQRRALERRPRAGPGLPRGPTFVGRIVQVDRWHDLVLLLAPGSHRAPVDRALPSTARHLLPSCFREGFSGVRAASVCLRRNQARLQGKPGLVSGRVFSGPQGVGYGPAWIRTRDRRIMSPLL